MRSQMSNVRQVEQQKEMEFLRDFDLLTKITPEEEILYGPADLDRGNEMMKANFVHKEDGTPYTMKSHIDDFQRFGPGIYLLFKLLKYLSVVFGVVSLFAMSSIIVLLIGEKPNNSSISSEFRSGILNTTIYRLSQPNFSPYVGLHFTIGVLIGVFLVYWREKERFYVIECLKASTLASYSTVVISDKTEKFSENDLSTYLNKNFGEIAEIYTVKNFGEDILKYKEINELVQDYKEEKSLTELENDRNCNKLMNLFFKFRQEHFDLKRIIKESENYKACFTFVRFKKIEDREKLIEFESKKNFICCFKSEKTSNNTNDFHSEPSKIDTNKLKIKECEMEPCGIIWENLHLPKSSKAIKISVVVFLLLLVLTISCFLIFLLSVMQMSVSNSKFKDYEKEELIKLEDEFALLSYCVNLSFSEFYKQYDLCSNYRSEYIKLTIMMLLIPVSISLFKFVLTEIMTALLHFRRYSYEISRIESQATIIFIFYFLVTGPFQLFVYLGSESASIFNMFTPILKSFVNEEFDSSKITLFDDYSPDWYVLSSSNIFMIGAMSFNLSAIGIIFYCFIRSKIFQRFAIKQKIQIKMNFWLEGYHLEIEYVYGAILTIVYFTLLFGGTMPLLYPLAFVSFLILFWSYKYVFINFCIKPLIFNHSVNRKVSKMMFGALLIHCIFTPIFYHAPHIANFEKSESFIERIFSLWYYFILFLVICGYLLLEKSIRILYPMLKKYFQKIKTSENQNQKGLSLDENIHKSEQKPVRRQFALPTIVRRRHNWLNSESYSMHENPIYKEILKTLYTINNKERARKSFILNAGLFHLYEDTIKTNEFDSKALNDVIQLVRRDFKKYSLKHKKSNNNPYLKSKKRLYEIYQSSKKGEARKYTLNFSGSTGFREMESGDGFFQNGYDNYSEGMTKEDAIFDSLASEAQKKRKPSRNENVIEQASSMSSNSKGSLKMKRASRFSNQTDEIITENSNSRKNSEKVSIQNNLPSNGTFEIPQSSEDRINESKL